MSMPSEHTIRFASDGHQLTGTLHLPDQVPAPVIIGCHGLLADRRSPKQIALAQALNQIGLAYFRFDHRGCGDSQGVLQAADLLAARCRDLQCAVATMQSHAATGPVAGLFGSSFGGTVVMAMAARHPVNAIITYAAPVHSGTISEAVVNDIRERNAIRADAPSDFSFDICPSLAALTNILVIHCEKDEIVPRTHAMMIHEAARFPKQLIVYEGGDHRLSDPAYQHRFIEACIAWYRERLADVMPSPG